MHKFMVRLPIAALLFHAAAAGVAHADVCVTVDEKRDTFSPENRGAAVLLLESQFEAAGEPVLHDGCPAPYMLSHIALGNTIHVRLSGPKGDREGTALGMDDLPALYNQMVRSLLTGRPMKGFNVVDRTNVTAAQSSAERVQGDSLWYARLGYGGVFGDRTYGSPAMGFGYRYELDSVGVDVSFFNVQSSSGASSYYGPADNVATASLLKLEGLYFLQGRANKTTYVGGGLSWGSTGFGSGWSGSGLQGELTAGYELPRASTLRIFIQTDVTLPFYNVSATRYPVDYPRTRQITTERRYAPSLAISIGVGWQKGRRGRG